MGGDFGLQGHNRVQNRLAHSGGQRFDERRIILRQQILRIRINDRLNLLPQKFFAEKLFDDGFLRNEFFADGFPDGVRQFVSVARNHSLRKNCQTEQLNRISRTKKHPHGEPRAGVTVKSSDDDERGELHPGISEKFLNGKPNLIQKIH